MKRNQILSLICIIVIPLIIIGVINFTRIRSNDLSGKDEFYLKPYVMEPDSPVSEVEWPKVAKQKDTDRILKAIEQQEVDETSYIDELDRIYVGKTDKDFFLEILENSEKVTYYSMSNAPDFLCQYMIYIGGIELGYKSSLIYQNDEYLYIFQLTSDDRIKMDEWIDGLVESR